MRKLSPALLPVLLATVLFVSSAFAMMEHGNAERHYSDRAFLSGMIAHHEGAVLMAKHFLASKNQDPQVTAWAKEIIATQDKEIMLMKKLLPAAGGMDQEAFNSMQKAMEAMMRHPAGSNPNGDFVAMMLPHHAQALEMSAPALEFSQNPEVLNLAESIIIAQAKEMRAFKTWLAQHKK